MKIKVCGMRDATNIADLITLPIDYIGMIFYPKSSRYISAVPDILIPDRIKKVGVFVNASETQIREKVKTYRLDYVQLHGNESPEFCSKLADLHIVKAISISNKNDLQQIHDFEDVVEVLLLDTKNPKYGGSGEKFDWKILDHYDGKLPFMLSGGISEEDADQIKKIAHPKLYGIDLNSKFEQAPALKNIEQLKQFVQKIKDL